jgi:UrcA family protein
MYRTLALLFAVPIAFTSSTSCLAQRRADLQSVKVSARDLDLTSSLGQKALDRRIRAAAAEVCPPPVNIMDTESQRCIHQAVRGARSSRDSLIAELSNSPERLPLVPPASSPATDLSHQAGS